MDTSASAEQALAETTVEGPVCQHQWVIDSPNGPTSHGKCRLCKEEREFVNYIEGSSWGYDVSLEQLSGGSRLPSNMGKEEKIGLAEED